MFVAFTVNYEQRHLLNLESISLFGSDKNLFNFTGEGGNVSLACQNEFESEYLVLQIIYFLKNGSTYGVEQNKDSISLVATIPQFTEELYKKLKEEDVL